MKINNERPVWVIGHKNPDTDSICSAIAYAYFKNQTDEGTFIPKKAGALNSETAYVLDRFGVEEPETVSDVCTEIKDIDYRESKGVSKHLSLRKAWSLMTDNDVSLLPIVDKSNFLKGIIVRGDIAKSYMNVYGNDILGKTRTQYSNIIETLNGELLSGNSHAYFMNGRVVVPSGSVDMAKMDLEEDDLIICGDGSDRLLEILDTNPSCIVVTNNNTPSEEVKTKAEEIQCVLMTTEYDTFTAARLINQSIPVSQFMTDISDIISFNLEDTVDEVTEKISKVRYRDFPVLDENNKFVGTFSRRNLLDRTKKKLILVDHNETSQAVDGIDEAEILEIVDHHKIGSIETMAPIYFRNMPLGCSSTIIYLMFQERKLRIPKDIAGLMLSAILSDTLMFRSPTCTEKDKEAALELAKICNVDYEELATSMFEAGSDFASKTPSEIVYGDYKTFYAGDLAFGVAQVSAVSRKMLDDIKGDVCAYLPNVLEEKGVSNVFVLLTDIFKETSEVVMLGDVSKDIMKGAFYKDGEVPEIMMLDGVVSRKKQFIPPVMAAIGEL
ncbi:MAG: putative manganese-dependent inorganic diphosphatase [Lachnospiraceae bacterium]|nr:putative manganese-dependent inorganic diphosphatase [Lachnospiraceae bacterium]